MRYLCKRAGKEEIFIFKMGSTLKNKGYTVVCILELQELAFLRLFFHMEVENVFDKSNEFVLFL